RLCSTIGRRPSRTACACVIGMHTRPRPCFARKLIFSGLTNLAANTRSPSFSRSSSSTRMTISPARIAPMISTTGLMAAASRRMNKWGQINISARRRTGSGNVDLTPFILLGRGLRFLAAGALADAGRLAGASAQVVELGAAHVPLALELDRGDQRRIGLEGALDALARGD